MSDVRWQNPHPEISLEVSSSLEVPEDLAATGISRELEEIGGRQSLERAVVPEGTGGNWNIEVESPSFMEGVGMDSPPRRRRTSAGGGIFEPQRPAHATSGTSRSAGTVRP